MEDAAAPQGSKMPPKPTGGGPASAAGSSATTSQRRLILEPPLPLAVHTTTFARSPTSGIRCIHVDQ